MTEVSDYRAILAYLDNEGYRWNANEPLGTAVFISYRFATAPDLPGLLADDNPYGANSFRTYTAAEKAAFREALGLYEAVGMRSWMCVKYHTLKLRLDSPKLMKSTRGSGSFTTFSCALAVSSRMRMTFSVSEPYATPISSVVRTRSSFRVQLITSSVMNRRFGMIMS